MRKFSVVSLEKYQEKNPEIVEQFSLAKIGNKKIEEIKVYLLKDVLLLSNGIIYGKDNIPVESFWHPNYLDIALEDTIYKNDLVIKNGQVNLENESYLSLFGLWDTTFWHWMTEYLPRIIVSESFGFRGKYLVTPGPTFIQESLEMLGISENRIVFNDLGINIQVSNLLFPDWLDTSSDNYLIQMSVLRETFLNSIKLKSGKENRVYLSRKNATNGRKILNEPELLEILAKYNFKTVIMDGLSLKEQVQIAANCNFLLGGHGAASLHSMFMPYSSTVIELFSPNYINYCLSPFIRLLKHSYIPLVSEKITGYDTQDIIAPLEIIKLTLEKYFG